MKPLKIVRIAKGQNISSREMAEADLVIDDRKVLIKNRYGTVGRLATSQEIQDAVAAKGSL